MAELWGDYTDILVNDIDGELGNKYGKMSVRKFLTDPSKYISPNIVSDSKKMRDDVNAYVDKRLEGMAEEKKALDNSIMKAETITNQLAQNISMNSKQNKLPFIKPALLERDLSKDEVIYIDYVDNGVMALIERLAASSTYIADNTGSFKDHKIGEWVFGGAKNYVLRVYVPQNDAMLTEMARDELNVLFDNAAEALE
ncbi:MAG: hypothetical protein ACHQX1_00660 [Candidatus Micrarchaeales archaeon]